ncbi:MAG: PLDc N-terminal domain-containing protein, partial [Clostridia bacterium]|nr:PLDc N-terminal domain-containing protein [Clostridia bacterium]
MKLLTRILITLPAIILQIAWMIFLVWLADGVKELVDMIVAITSFNYVLYIVTKRDEGSYKILWLILILAFPVPGTFLYWCYGNQKSAKPIRKKIDSAKGEIKVYSEVCNDELINKISEEDPHLATVLMRTQKETEFPVVRNENARYFALGETMHRFMLEELKKAKKFIFAEYFIVENGIMWDSMVDIMAQKVQEGVEVYFMYDDVGSISTYSRRNVKDLKSKGIKCVSFNPIKFFSGTLNYRDHRKMLIIDGETAFSGGVNLADEYINKKKKYGHWKDIGFSVKGAAAQVYTRMFVEFCNAFSNEPLELEKYFPT